MSDKYTDRLDDLMDRYVFGLLDEVASGRVRRRIEEDPEWKLAYEAAAGRKKALAAGIEAGAAEAAATRAPTADDVLAAAKAAEARSRFNQRVVRGVFGGVAAAAAVVVAALWLHYAAIAPPTHAVRLIGQTELLAGSTASLTAIVTDLAGKAQPNVPVTLLLRLAGSQREVSLAQWVTDSSGRAGGQVAVPDSADGECALIARADTPTASTIAVPVTVRRAVRLYLSTDKPIYQPGQTVHMRCLALRKPALRPDAGRKVQFSLTDPSGNVIFSQAETLSDFGIAWADLPTDPLISPGRYTVKVSAGADASEQTIEIYYYKLPAFAVRVELDRPYYLPGQTVAGKVHVQYHFGKPVAGAKVEVELTGRPLAMPESLRKTTVTTDADGKAEFRIELPETVFGSRRTAGDAHLLLSVRATDPAGQENTAYRTLVVAAQDIRIAVVAENGSTARGLESRVFIVTSYPDGRPAKTTVDVESLGRSFKTDEAGVAVLAAERFPDPLRISARDATGKTGKASVSLPAAAGRGFILRTDKPFYTAGQTANVEVIAASAGEVFVDVVKDRQTVLTRTLTVTGGRGTLALDLPAELSGILHLHAYRLDDESEWVGRDVLIVVRPAGQLKVTVEADSQTYRPGEEAKLTFQVADPAGKAAPTALSLAAVDEAVFSVQQAAAGLEAVLTGLDEELLAAAVEVHGFSPPLMEADDDYARALLAAAATDAPGPAPRGRAGPVHTLDRGSAEEAQAGYARRKSSAEDTAKGGTVIGGVVALLAALLLGMFWSLGTPRPGGGWFTARSGLCLAGVIVVALSGSILLPSLGSYRGIAALDAPMARQPFAETRAAVLLPHDSTLRRGRPGEHTWGPSQGEQPARVRTYFPETMLWRPQLVTDEAGRAELTIPLADSITTWRLSGSAVNQAGRLGRVDAAIRVFQPFFVNVDAPLSLTAGDEVSVPLVLYNYTAAPLEVALSAEGANGLAVLDGEKASVLVAPGQVKRVYVRTRAERIGDGLLTVNASGGQVADAIRKPIRIDPPGLPQSLAVNGQIGAGEQFAEILVPGDAVPGSVTVRMKIYPSTFSELLDGLEGIFRMPNGCFEQTSSTTWPNVMALSYMKANDMDRPEVVAKARRYIHLGCQRLVSFEVPGGGFDWFGRPPANVVLTAYGLMEFTDMAKVHPVDPKLPARTAEWLAGRQKSDGTWAFQQGIFHEPFTGGDSSDLACTAYVTWALATHDPADPAAGRGADYVARHLAETDTPMTLALCANALLTLNRRHPAGLNALDRLTGMAREDAEGGTYWPSAAPGGPGGRLGRWDNVSPTALAALAMMKANQQPGLVREALRWLSAARDPSGTWGSTTPTVLALKALLTGSAAPEPRDRPATVAVHLADEPATKPPLATLTIRPEQSEAVHTVRLAGITRPGRYRLRLSPQQAEGMAYQFAVRYHRLAAEAPAAESALAVKVDYDRTNLEVGGTATVRATVTNNTNAAANMLVVDLGTPPGFAVRPDGLEKLKAAGRIQRYTLTARGVIVYVDQLGPGASLDITYEIVARMPLKAVAAATLVYSYYNPDRMAAAAPATFEVK